MILLQLPYPPKILWPNGGEGNKFAKAREKKKHKSWAYMAALQAGCHKHVASDGLIPIRITVSCKPKGPSPDRDNVVAAAKCYLDGIALAMGVNDKTFAAPIVHFSGRQSNFTIEVG
jgi:crossover junction endodeoxyribonuclease RusA